MKTFNETVSSIIRARRVGTNLVKAAVEAAKRECSNPDAVAANAAAQSLVSGLNKLASAGLEADAKAIVRDLDGYLPFIIVKGQDGYRKGRNDPRAQMSVEELKKAEQEKLNAAKKRADALTKSAAERKDKLERFPVLEARVDMLQAENSKLKLANAQLEDKLLTSARQIEALKSELAALRASVPAEKPVKRTRKAA